MKPVFLLLALLLVLPLQAQQPAHTFAIAGDRFTLDGQPIQVLSGEIHYSRIPREYWRDRIRMARAMGLNTIATYIFWNVHEPTPGHFDFSGQNDLAAFLRIADEEHMHVLLRAGPYSCAEWEFGGFPAWLLKDPKMQRALRSDDPAFMVPVARWMTRLAQEVKPFLAENGGPILAVQVENEYGNFGGEPSYMPHMLEIFKQAGFGKSFLYTVDPSKALARGSIPGVFSGVNFGTGRAEPGLAVAEALRPGQPLFSTEYWPGWFDLWGHPHETRPLAPQLADLEYMLSHHASFNLYMFHGGTSFGQMAGASASTGNYRGNVTSYDYGAPLDEAGHPTPRFFSYRDVILKHTGEHPLPLPALVPVVTIPPFTLHPTLSYDVDLPQPTRSETLLTMEQVDQSYGYILYRTQLPSPIASAPLVLDPVHDFAVILLDGKPVGTLDRHYNQTTLSLTTTGPAQLDILVENTGRLNSTRGMRTEWKGIRSATLAGQPLTHWQIFPLPMGKPAAAPVASDSRPSAKPHFATGSFSLAQTGDAFLDVSTLGKGVLWINGHALGRFWNIGPQQTLYVPAPWLRKGENRVDVFDLLPSATPPTLVGRDQPILDGPTPAYKADPELQKTKPADAEFGPKLTAPKE